MRDETIATLTKGMQELGLDASRFFREASQQSKDPGDVLARFWDIAQAATGDPWLPARVGLAAPFGTFGLLDYLAASSATLDGALDAISRHLIAVTNAANYIYNCPQMVVNHKFANTKQLLFMTSIMISRTRHVVGAETIQLIELTSGDSVPSVPLRALFGVTVIPKSSVNRITFIDHALKSKLKDANPELNDVLRRVGAQLGYHQPVDSVATRVMARLPGLCRRQRPSADDIARSLGMSRRALSRALESEGTTARQLVDRWAQTEATRMLERGVPIVEVAEAIGYADQATFTRAFLRWTGHTPGAWRRGVPAFQSPKGPDAS
jgi:AraC-like DNA-binding protein